MPFRPTPIGSSPRCRDICPANRSAGWLLPAMVTPSRAGGIAPSYFCWFASAYGPATWQSFRLIDIEWQAGSLRVMGKSRYEVRLPLPQDVGDAIAAYLECRPPCCRSDRVFLSTIAPAARSGTATASRRLFRRVMKRGWRRDARQGCTHPCGIPQRPRCYAMGSRSTRSAWSSGIVVSTRPALYAKADVTLLKQVAQPWPEVL